MDIWNDWMKLPCQIAFMLFIVACVFMIYLCFCLTPKPWWYD